MAVRSTLDFAPKMHPWTHPPLRWHEERPSTLRVGSASELGSNAQPSFFAPLATRWLA
jgi:hypothetical protein